jgi:hypothetical protein
MASFPERRDILSFVIPGRAFWRGTGIHTLGRGYGFSDAQLRIKARSLHSRPGMTKFGDAGIAPTLLSEALPAFAGIVQPLIPPSG